MRYPLSFHSFLPISFAHKLVLLGILLGVQSLGIAVQAQPTKDQLQNIGQGTRVTLKPDSGFHAHYGQGLVVEVDLQGLKQPGTSLLLEPVAWPFHEYRRANTPDVHRYRNTKNPLVALGAFFGAMGKALSGLRRIEEPLIPRQVYPLNGEVLLLEKGVLQIDSLPENEILQLLIPYSTMADTDRVFFVLPAYSGPRKPYYLATPLLIPQEIPPILTTQSIQHYPTRYEGASGEMVVLEYQFPGYLLETKPSWKPIVPTLVVNGKDGIPPTGDYGRNEPIIQSEAGELRFFLPDYLFHPSGEIPLELSFQFPDPLDRVEKVPFTVEKSVSAPEWVYILPKKLAWKDHRGGYHGYYQVDMALSAGGYPLTPPRTSEWHSSGKKANWKWEDTNFLIQVMPEDTVQIEIFQYKGGRNRKQYKMSTFQLPIAQATGKKGKLTLISTMRNHAKADPLKLRIAYTRE